MTVFGAIKKNIAIIYQGKPDDYVYEDFYNDMSNGNMGLFDSINKVSNDSNGVLYALTLNNAVNDTNNVEYFLKIVNDIYLNKCALNIPLSLTDSNTLDYISELPLALAGRAKYIAAAILKKEVHENHEDNGNRIMHPTTNNENKIAGKVYPNPANEEIIFIAPEEKNAGQLLLRVYDSDYKLIYVRTFNSLFVKLNVKSSSQGIYNYTISCKNKNIASGKFSVIH